MKHGMMNSMDTQFRSQNKNSHLISSKPKEFHFMVCVRRCSSSRSIRAASRASMASIDSAANKVVVDAPTTADDDDVIPAITLMGVNVDADADVDTDVEAIMAC
jgi:hypothetical protein